MSPDSGTLDRSGPGELNATDKNAIEEALRRQGRRRRRGRGRHDGPRGGDGVVADRPRHGRRPGGARRRPGGRRLRPRRDEPGARRRARAGGPRPRPVRAADQRRRRRGAVGRGGRAVAVAVRVPGDEAHAGDGVVTVERETEFGNDVIEAKLPAVVAVSDAINEPRYTSLKGMMAREEEAAGHVDGVRPRDRGRTRWASPARRPWCSASGAPPARDSRRHARGRRHRGPGHLRLPGGARPRMSLLVFLEHHEHDALARVARRAHQGGRARPRRRRGARRRRRPRAARGARPGATARPPCSPRSDAYAISAARPPHRRARRARAPVRGLRLGPVLELGPRGRCRRRARGSPRRRHQLGPRRPRAHATVSRSASSRRCRTPCSPRSGGGRRSGSRCSAPARSRRCRRRRSANRRSKPPTVAFAAHTPRGAMIERTAPCRRRPVTRRRRGHRRRRHRPRLGRELRARRGARRGARRRGGRDARRGVQGLVSRVGADRPDRQDGLAEALRRPRASRARCSTRSGCRTRR